MACSFRTGSRKCGGESRWDLAALAGRAESAETYQGATRLSSQRWVARMIKKAGIDSELWSVLEKGRIADLSQFHTSPMLEEVPLYTRQADISFLSDLPLGEINRILVGFSLRFLRSVIAYEAHRTPYFAAISIWNFSDDEPVVPNLFVWSGPIRLLHDKLKLTSVLSPFSRKIKQLSPQHRPHDVLDVLEETPRLNDSTRVFIGPAEPPYRSFVTPSKLLKAKG